ncbi:ankyrin [Choiromyces venosus 120613-1]|uniref:Ankyrin n=1 Tax=Choiromyces venosus 120613-1 TaxID=1336337 RepID=A0A3N4JLD7_9PEZI|nr:ankyrin [Choiromyces venosus 120613-1]
MRAGMRSRKARISLLDLPSEIICQIGQYHSPPELYSLLRTHRRLALLLGPLLVESIFHTNSTKYAERALSHALHYGDNDAIEYLLNRGILTLIELENVLADERSLSTFLYCGLDPDYQDERGRTLLSIAASSGQASIVEFVLIELDPDVNTIDNSGRCALHAAAMAPFPDALEILLEDERLDINLQDNRGNTPLHLAVFKKRVQAVQLLLTRWDLDITIKNHRNLTPAQASQVDYRARDKTISDALLGRVLSSVKPRPLQPRLVWREEDYMSVAGLQKQYPPIPPPPTQEKPKPKVLVRSSCDWQPQFLPAIIAKEVERNQNRTTKARWERVKDLFAGEKA